MHNFQEKAKYYDLLYKEKNYAEEIQYVLSFLDVPSIREIIDFGCGTGGHLIHLENQFEVQGYDISTEMIQFAKEKLSTKKLFACPIEVISGNQADLIYSLFHVINYQTTDLALHAFFKSAYENLSNNGILCFDFWNKKMVDIDPPISRKKTFEGKDGSIIRTSYPTEKMNGVFEILFHFQIDMFKKHHNFSETHKLKPYSKSKLTSVANAEGFKDISFYDWMNRTSLSNAWYGFALCKK